LERLSSCRGRALTLRMAPMIDMIFLLLIFFLLTARFRPMENFLPLQLDISSPAEAGRAALVEPLMVYISPAENGCEVRLGRNMTVDIGATEPEVGLSLLADKLTTSLQQQKRTTGDPVEIICDANVEWEHPARIYNVLFGMGITDITFRMTD
jgi:biopolymer transport protein ExbD